jgi:hypothetical protein
MNQSSVSSKMKNGHHQHTELPLAVASLDVRISAGETSCLEFLD